MKTVAFDLLAHAVRTVVILSVILMFFSRGVIAAWKDKK